MNLGANKYSKLSILIAIVVHRNKYDTDTIYCCYIVKNPDAIGKSLEFSHQKYVCTYLPTLYQLCYKLYVSM